MFKVKVVTPQGLYRVLETSILNVRTTDGQRGILTNHVPLVTMLTIGEMSTIEDGQRYEYALSGGMLYFKDNLATILTDAIERSDEIDLERAEEAKRRAQERISSKGEIDILRAEVALRKAINRISVAK